MVLLCELSQRGLCKPSSVMPVSSRSLSARSLLLLQGGAADGGGPQEKVLIFHISEIHTGGETR